MIPLGISSTLEGRVADPGYGGLSDWYRSLQILPLSPISFFFFAFAFAFASPFLVLLLLVGVNSDVYQNWPTQKSFSIAMYF